MARLRQQTVLTFRRGEFGPLYWSVPRWESLAADPARRGMVRHGGLSAARSHVDEELKRPYPEHAAGYLLQAGDPAGVQSRTLLAWGSRNIQQNLGLPGWHAGRKPHLLCRPDEPWRQWTYHALCGLLDGSPALAAVQFRPLGGTEDAVIAFADDSLSADAAGIEWAVTGQPLLWDGELPSLELLAAHTYDLRHVWQLQWEAWQGCPDEQVIHGELMASFMGRLEAPAAERAADLAAIAGRHSLRVTDSYLHSSVGLSADGGLNLVMQTGSLTDLGRAHEALGSRRAILLDNGGSVGAAYWSRHVWARLGWAGVGERPAIFGNGTYFRPHGHSVLLTELAEDIPEGPSAFAR